jgi:hypothetical protein
MAHFAQLDENNTVIQVIVIRNEDTLDRFGNESEDAGIEYCQAIFGPNTIWKQTSYNDKIRVRYAQIGGKYDPTRDAFIRPRPYVGWVFNETKLDWEPPFPPPNDGKYIWDDETINWRKFE